MNKKTFIFNPYNHLNQKLATENLVNSTKDALQSQIDELSAGGITTLTAADGSGLVVTTPEGKANERVIGVNTEILATKASVDLKANAADVYNKTEIDGKLEAVDTAINLKANAADVYTKGETDTAVATAKSEAIAASAITIEGQATQELDIVGSDNVTVTPTVVAAAEGVKPSVTYTIATTGLATSGELSALETRVGATETAVTTTLPEAITKAQSDAEANAATAAQGKVDALKDTVISATDTDDLVTVTLGGTVGAPSIDVVVSEAIAKAADLTSLSDRIDALHATPQFSVAVVDSLPETLVENTIYLVPMEGSTGTYVEYIAYKSGDAIVSEQIGSTAIDLSDYAKSADVTKEIDDDVAAAEARVKVTTDALSGRIDTLEAIDHNTFALKATSLEKSGSDTDGFVTVATAGSLETGIESITVTTNDIAKASDLTTLSGTVATNAQTAATGIQEAKDAAAAADGKAVTAQNEVDALEGVVATLTQTVTDNKTAADAAAKEAKDAADAAQADATQALADAAAADAKAVAAQGAADAKVASITAGDYVAVDASTATAPKVSVTVNGEVAESNTGLVTGGTVDAAIKASAATLDAKIAGNTTDIGKNAADILTVTGRVDTAEDAIDALETAVDGILAETYANEEIVKTVADINAGVLEVTTDHKVLAVILNGEEVMVPVAYADDKASICFYLEGDDTTVCFGGALNATSNEIVVVTSKVVVNPARTTAA